MRKNAARRDEPSAPAGEGQGGVYLLGARKDVERLYQAMDVFVLPSRYEGLPVVAVEAQAAGLPCVLSDRVTGEAKITDNVCFLGLDEGSAVWAEALLETKKNHRETGCDLSRFEIKYQAEKLADYYIDSI